MEDGHTQINSSGGGSRAAGFQELFLIQKVPWAQNDYSCFSHLW